MEKDYITYDFVILMKMIVAQKLMVLIQFLMMNLTSRD